MKIILEKERNGRTLDFIEYILNCSQKEFDKIISNLEEEVQIELWYLSDSHHKTKNKKQIGIEQTFDDSGNYIGIGYFGHDQKNINELFNEIKGIMLNSNILNQKDKEKLEKLLNSRNIELFKRDYERENDYNYEIIDEAFEVLKSENIEIDDDISYINNTTEYPEILTDIFGKINKKGEFLNKNIIFKEYFIQDIDKYKKQYIKYLKNLSNILNPDIFLNSEYKFPKKNNENIFESIEQRLVNSEKNILAKINQSLINSEEIQKTMSNEIIMNFKNWRNEKLEYNINVREEEEPYFEISSELRKKIFEEMPNELTVEEKAIYMYYKLCKELNYDQGYFYRAKMDENKYTPNFNRERLEKIKPGSKVICFDFVRICVKLINEIGDEIEAVIIKQGTNQGHFSIGFYTDQCSTELEGTLKIGKANDMMNVKMNNELKGINCRSDNNNTLEKAVKTAIQIDKK